MEAMLALMARLQELGYSEENGFYKTTFISPGKDVKVEFNTEYGTYNAIISKGVGSGCVRGEVWEDYDLGDIDRMVNATYYLSPELG